MLSPGLPDSTWGPILLSCVALCLTGTSSADTRVIQSPRYLIKARGGRAAVKCFPISEHNSVAWYQQTLGQGLEFLIQHYEMTERSKGNLPDRFSVQQFRDYHSEMNMSALELGDSAVYFCASSSAQPCKVTGSLYPNLPVPADNIME